MVASETGTDGHVHFKPTRFRVEEELRGTERIVFVELKESIVESPLVWLVKIIDAEVEVEEAVSLDHGAGDWLFLQLYFLLLKPFDRYLLICVHILLLRG